MKIFTDENIPLMTVRNFVNRALMLLIFVEPNIRE